MYWSRFEGGRLHSLPRQGVRQADADLGAGRRRRFRVFSGSNTNTRRSLHCSHYEAVEDSLTHGPTSGVGPREVRAD